MDLAIRLLRTALLLLAGALLPVAASPQDTGPALTARLISASASPAPASDTDIGLVLAPPRGWHIYWQNPGDSGYAPRFSWHLPAGVTVSEPRHPAPARMVLGGIAMNVHLGTTLFPARLHVPADIATGTVLPIAGTVDLLVCSEESCVPRNVAIGRRLTVGSGTPDPTAVAALRVARAALPTPISAPARYRLENGTITLGLPLAAPAPGETWSLFASAHDAGAFGPVRINSAEDGWLEISASLGTVHPRPGMPLVLVSHRADGTPSRAFTIAGEPGDPGRNDAGHGGGAAIPATLIAFAGAVVGGLLLNLMPCVFPILSLKAMALVRSGGGAKEARAEALGYLAGAAGTMVALGAAVLMLRAGGQAVGWAFQLQNPAMVAVLLLVVTGVALNLAGLFELPALGELSGNHNGFVGGVSTGALAAFIATPCTGPFMAGALGAALVLPATAALAVFGGLGVGLASPFLLISFWEPARRRMPRPGQWMVTLRHSLSVPMFATALGLAWLIGEQAGIGAMTAALGAALAGGLALWWAGLCQRRGHRAWPALPGLIVALAIATLGVGNATALPARDLAKADGPLPYSATRLADLRAHHRPVLLYATAQWCLTCKVNEASSLAPARVRASFADHGAVMMEADWTRGDPEVTRLLTRNGRAGVPLYLWYPANGPARVLPQVLTPDLVTGLVGTP